MNVLFWVGLSTMVYCWGKAGMIVLEAKKAYEAQKADTTHETEQPQKLDIWTDNP